MGKNEECQRTLTVLGSRNTNPQEARFNLSMAVLSGKMSGVSAAHQEEIE